MATRDACINCYYWREIKPGLHGVCSSRRLREDIQAGESTVYTDPYAGCRFFSVEPYPQVPVFESYSQALFPGVYGYPRI